jgi:hypothetical protein
MATAAAKKSAAPETGAAPIEAPIPEVRPEDVRIEAGQHTRRILVHLPAGAVGDDVRNPKLWRKVQATRTNALIKYDELLILTHDESQYLRAIVTDARHSEAFLCIEKTGTFRTVSSQLYCDGRFRVHFTGGAYVVQRISDGVIVDGTGYSTEQQAIRAIERQYPTRAVA